MRPMEATHFPTAAILPRRSFLKSVCCTSCRTFGTNPSARWKQNVGDVPIDDHWSVNALTRHSRLVPFRRNACAPDFRFPSSPTLLFTSRRLFSQRAFSSTSFFYSASNRKKQWNHSMKNTTKKGVVQSFEIHRMASLKNSDQKGSGTEKSTASDPVSIDVLYDVLRGMRNKTNTNQTPSPLSTSSFSSSSYVNSRQRSGDEKKLRQEQPKNVSPTATILPFSPSSSACKSTDLSHFSQRSSSKASSLVSSILAIVDEDMTASPASRTTPPLKPVTPQEWYRHVTTHMKHVLSALEDASSFISASPTAAAHASSVTASQKSRGKRMTLCSLEAVVLHATREIDALPEDVLLPLSPPLQQKKTSSSGTTAVAYAQDWKPPLRCPSSDSQNPSDASTCTSFSFSQRIAAHPPLFFAAILGSAWSCLLNDVWEMRNRYASHSHPQCQTSFVVSPSCLSTPSSSSPFFPSQEGEHPSHPAASTSESEAMARGTGKRPHCCTPCPCRCCLSWKLLGQRIRFGMHAYHQLVQQLLLTPEGKHVTWCGTPMSSTASSPNAEFEPPVSLSSCDMEAPSERVAGTTRSMTPLDGRGREEEEACGLGWWSSVQLPLMHISLGGARRLRSLFSTSSFEVAAGPNSSDEDALVAEEEALLSLEKACQEVGRRVQEREVQCVRNEMRWNRASLCTHAVSSSSSLPYERSPARHAWVESLEHPHEKSKKGVWRSWSSFQRARAAASSLLRVLSHFREQGWGMRKIWTEDDVAQAVVPVMCLFAMTRLLQRWEYYDAERMRTFGRVSRPDALPPLAPRPSLVSATQAGSMAHTRASSTEAEAPPPPASSSFVVHSSSWRPFSRRPSPPTVHAWCSDRLYVALREEVLEQLEQLKEWAGIALPLQSRRPSFPLTIPPPSHAGPPPPPPIVHRTIHTSLNLLLAELCEDREIPTCEWEAKTSSCAPLGATFSDSRTSTRSAYTPRGADDTGVRSEETQRTTKGNTPPLEIRVYLLLRLSALLRRTGEMYFSTPPEDATPPSSVGASSWHASPVWMTSLPSPPRPWVIALFGRLVRLCLEVEQDSSFQVYRQFHLRPHTPIDPVVSFVAEEASSGTWKREMSPIKSIQLWKALLLEEEFHQGGEEATPLSAFPFPLPPPAATMGRRCTPSCVAVPSSCHSLPTLLSVDHTNETEKGEKEKERPQERRKSWEEWYLPSVLLAYALQLRAFTTEFIYHALLFWSAVTGESAAVPSPHVVCLPHTHGVSPVRDRKEGEKDPWTAKERNACMETTPQDAKKKKNEREEETKRNVPVHTPDENHNGEIVMRVFIGKFENIFYALLRREYLFGTQEKELLSMWYEKKVWRRHALPEHHPTLARSSRVHEPRFVEETSAPFYSSCSSSFCGSVPICTRTEIDSEITKRKREEQDPNGGLDGCTNDPLLSPALPVSIGHVLHAMISSFSVDSCQKDVYTYCLKSFLWIREVSASSSTPSRGIGKKSCFTACGIRLSQAIEVSYFLFLCEQRWPHLLTLRDPARTPSRDPLSIPRMKGEERIKVERNGHKDDTFTMDEDEEHYLPHMPNAVEEYAHEVFLRLEHSTAKQLWHLRSAARHPKKKKNGDGLFYFTGESQDRVYLQDPVMRSRHAQSILSVVHAHVVHPSLLWAPLWQVQELVAVFAFCRASHLLSQRKRTEKRHRFGASPPTPPPSIQRETSLDSTVSPPVDDSTPVLQKNTEREESSIWDASLSKKTPVSHRAHAVNVEGELLEFSGNETNPLRDDQENEEDGAEAPLSERMTVVVGSQQSNLSLFHGYLILRIYVMSNVLRQWRETWVDALLVGKERKEKGIAHAHLSGDPHGSGVLLGETEMEWCSTEVQTKLEALWRLEKFEPERERVASSSSGEEDSADSLETARTSSGRFRRRRRKWALEMVNDLMHASVPPCAALGVDHTANAPNERICRSPSFSDSSIPVSTPKKGSFLPPPMPLRLLPARMEGTKDACWGAIRSIQRVEKMIQLMTRNKLFFHVLQDRHERWRQAEEEEEHHLIPKEDQERETVPMQGREQMDSGEARSGDVYDDGDGIAPFSPFSSLLSNPSTSTLPVVPNEKQYSMRESIHLSIQRPDASSPMGFVLSAAEGRILRVQKRFHDDWERTEGEKSNEGNLSASSRTSSDGKELDESNLEEELGFLTPIAVAARKAGIESVHYLVQYYVCAVDDHEVENGKDVARLLKGKSFFTLRLEKTNKKQA